MKIILSICIAPLMLIGGFYVYRCLNDKLMNSHTWLGLFLWSTLLFTALGAIFSGGLFAMAIIYQYLTQ